MANDYVVRQGSVKIMSLAPNAGQLLTVDSNGVVIASASLSGALGAYTTLTTTAYLTGSLQTQITNEVNTRTAADLVLQTEINNITGGAFVLDNRYTTLPTTAYLTGGLQTQITNEVNDRTAADAVLQTEINNITGGSFVLDNRYTTLSTTAYLTGGLQSQITNIGSTYTLLTTTASVSANLQSQINTKANDSAVVHNTGNENISGSKTFISTINAQGGVQIASLGAYAPDFLTVDGSGVIIDSGYKAGSFALSGHNHDASYVLKAGDTMTGSLTINGDLTVYGTQTTVNSQTVSTSSNLININQGEVGSGVTKGFAGILVDRGLSTDYLFVFEESRAAFTVGVSGNTQVVATRQDTPSVNGLAVWNSSQFRFDTSTNLTYDTVNGLVVATGPIKLGNSRQAYAENLAVAVGTTTIDSFLTSIGSGAEWLITVKNGTNVRTSKVLATWDGTNAQFTETSTLDLGDSSPVTFTVDNNGGNARLLAAVTTGTWVIKVYRTVL